MNLNRRGVFDLRGPRAAGAFLVAAASLCGAGSAAAGDKRGIEKTGDVPQPAAQAVSAQALKKADVEGIIARAVASALAQNLKATIVVTDREANVLGAFRMTGAPLKTKIKGRSGDPPPCNFGVGAATGLEGCDVPSYLAAISKAGTASFFETTGNAFTPRTASFIIQQHFPPGVELQPGGPLFGVQFSSLPCTDVTVPRGASSGFLPLGLSADPGGVPLYRGTEPVGGVGIEGDGVYTADLAPLAADQPESVEERVAVAASRGLEAPAAIRATEILVNGIRLPFTDVRSNPNVDTVPSFPSLSGTILVAPHDTGASRFAAQTLGGVDGFILVDGNGNNRFPFKAGKSTSGLTADDVERVVTQAAQTTLVTRAAIRRPIGSNARVSITVVDVDGTILGFFRTADAPIFGVDVSAQKARTAAFFSAPGAAEALREGGLGRYVDAAAADGLHLDGSVAFSDRGNGFLSRPFYPDGIDPNPPGPFSRPISEWSVFNDGLQLDLIKAELVATVAGVANTRPCSTVPGIPHGIQIFAGSVPLFKNGALVGAIGISGDGIDQDDFIATNGSFGFESPEDRRCDRVFVRGVRLPFVKFPRHPKL